MYGADTSPVLLTEAHTDRHPLSLMVSGQTIHVSEARGVGWARCMAGVRCDLGQQVEVLTLDPEAGTLDLMGMYGGTDRHIPYLATWGDRVVEPRPDGVQVYQAEVEP